MKELIDEKIIINSEPETGVLLIVPETMAEAEAEGYSETAILALAGMSIHRKMSSLVTAAEKNTKLTSDVFQVKWDKAIKLLKQGWTVEPSKPKDPLDRVLFELRQGGVSEEKLKELAAGVAATINQQKKVQE